MRIRAVAGIALIALLFVSALMETRLLDVTANEFFFDRQSDAGNQPLAKHVAG